MREPRSTALAILAVSVALLAERNLMRSVVRALRDVHRASRRNRPARKGASPRRTPDHRRAAPASRRTGRLAHAAAGGLLASAAFAQSEPAPASADAPPAQTPTAPTAWSLGDATGLNEFLKPARLVFSGYIETGVTLNPASPQDRQNFGRLFDDRANELLLNQAAVTLDRLMDTGDEFDWGARMQFMYGSDARFIHYTGEMDNITHDQLQPTFTELFLTGHLPLWSSGGLDLKFGQFVTLMGAETIDPRTNYFYSHTFMFNFGIPFVHTGGLATFHLPAGFNLVLGGVTGINTGFDDNNDSPAFHAALQWASSGSVIAVNSALHIGPENPSTVVAFDPDKELRYITDTVVTWTPDDHWQLIGDFVYGRDDGFDAEWYGAAGYVKYKVNDRLSIVGRAEIFRDDDGFAVLQYGDNDDPANAIRGLPVNDPRTVGGGATTYYEFTVGLNWKPIPNLMIRPETRWDLSNVSAGAAGGPFDDSNHRDQFTFGIDFILTF